YESIPKYTEEKLSMAGFAINHVVVSGNLTRDPELSSTPGGNDVCKLGIAVNERFKKDGNWIDRPNYFRVTIWGGVGRWAAEKLHKGDAVTLAGRLRWDSWERDGQKREAVEIVADSIIPGRERRTNEPEQTQLEEPAPF